ncbi:MAG: single-stranded-DNA-specific exonuclease RecJ [Rikenellaceae bacterium]|nr:single-stranded-DNA-specific exonuclease RecJ [Tidjanibacter sp.]MBQ5894055.1 single-stranded-DNA-specific exonuclease RecJ [Rikenellaceae bacterium]MBQ6605275.1 single-stranded-DNA-specific exonuclease RecJ [Tidjanibacter sp.]
MPIEKRWVIKPQGDKEMVESLAFSMGIPNELANLLVQRGITTSNEATRFFNPKLSDLHDPFLMKDMDKAVERVDEAVRNGEKIMVYGDYDVDGTTAVALVYTFLRQIGHNNLTFYIPDRYTEGYGVSVRSIDIAAKQGVTLVIALDCGIKAVEKVEYAKQKGIDFIICDHHLPGDEIPAAVAVLDPKVDECHYPFDELSGCGVGFKLVQGYAQKKNIDFRKVERLLDLVVVSTAADIVPLTGENRVLAYYGLKMLNENPRKGLKSIIKICGLDKHQITIDDIVFKIGPRINAAGRMAVDHNDENSAPSGGHAAVNLLIERDEDAAAHFGNDIESSNQKRKDIDRTVTLEAHEIIENNPEMKAHKSTVIYNPKWVKGIVGIVASRLIETYYKPTVVLTMSNGLATGSARSVPGFDLYQAVESCADLLENFGGHMYAAGLTMKPENVEEFTRRFHAYVEEHIDPALLVPQVEIDAEISFSTITPAFRATLSRFQPFGPGNSAPIFASRGVCGNDAKLVGAEQEHLRMDLTQQQKPNTQIAAIAFQQPDHYGWIRAGGAVDVCYAIAENHFRGIVTPQLRIKDIKPVR